MVGSHPCLEETKEPVESHGGNGNYEESPRKYQVEERRSTKGMPAHSHMASRTTPRPYMPTFLEAQRRDTNVLECENLESEWEVMEREYNALSVGFQRQVSLGEYCHIVFK
jgi:hypothetical protein